MRLYCIVWLLLSALMVGVAWVSNAWIFHDHLPSVRAKMGPKIEAVNNPQVVILGSSRAAFGIAPRVLAGELGLPADAVVNAAFPGMTPADIEKGWQIYEGKLKAAKLVLYFTDDYYLSDPPNKKPDNLFQEFTPLRKLGNVYGNLWSLVDKTEADQYWVDESGLLHHPMLDSDRIAEPQIFERVAASWAWKPNPMIEVQLVSFGKRLARSGTRVVFIHLPMHSEQRAALDKRPEVSAYLAGMKRVTEELGTEFYFLDRPQDLGLTDKSFVADPVHLRADQAEIQTKNIAKVLKRGAHVEMVSHLGGAVR